MKLFNLGNNRLDESLEQTNSSQLNEDATIATQHQEVARPDIPEHVFIETTKPKQQNSAEVSARQAICDLQTLYRHLEKNLEKKGYEDALINPDSSYMEAHIKFINNDLSLLISKIKTYYSGYLHTIDFHLETRERSGMVETVDELRSHKATILEEVKIVSRIEEEALSGTGPSQNLILSYRKGFQNGFAAITYNTILSQRNI